MIIQGIQKYSFCIQLQPRLSFLTWIASSLPSGYLKSSVQTTAHPSTALSLNSLQPILVLNIEKLLLAGPRPMEKPSGSCTPSRKLFAQQRRGNKSCMFPSKLSRHTTLYNWCSTSYRPFWQATPHTLTRNS